MARTARFLVPAILLGIISAAGASEIPVLNLITDEYSLQEVWDMPTGLRVYDKVFTIIDVTGTAQNGAVLPSADTIRVQGVWMDLNQNGIYDLADEWGIRIIGPWGAVQNQSADTVLYYKVTADAPFRISDNTLSFNAGAANGGLASVSEYVYDSPNFLDEPAYTKYVYYVNAQDNDTSVHFDFTESYETLWIEKDILVTGGTAEVGNASISVIYQTFSQVPEPLTVTLLMVGGAALLRRGRPKRLIVS